jgi:hypothetical protein
MRKVLVLPLAVAVVLAGCGKKEEPAAEGGKVSSGQAAAAAATMITPQPGLYKISGEILDLSFPGMPKGMVDQMKQSMKASFDATDCMTKEDVKDAVKKMAKGPQDGTCKYSKYNVSGNTISAVMDCGGKAGTGGTFTMNGTVAATSIDMTMEGDQKAPGMPGGAMHMKMHIKSQRVGECKT